MTRVKLCGLTRREEVAHAAKVGAEIVGLVVQAPASHRNLSLGTAAELVQAAPETVDTALVSPTDDAEALASAVDRVNPDVVQATGEIDHGTVAATAEAAGADAWRGLGLKGTAEETVHAARTILDTCQAVVLDALASGYGGHGETIDWAHAARAVDRLPRTAIVLAGGLTPENVAEAIHRVDPWCVDVSSGIETDERNDPDRMRDFVTHAKEASP